MQTIHLISLALPVLLLLVWKHARRVLYSGTAQLLPASVFIGRSGQNAFVSLIVPGIGEVLADLPVKTAQALPASAEPMDVEVVIHRSLVGNFWVESLKINGEVQNVNLVHGFPLLIAIGYMFGGFFALASALPVVSEVAFICAGYITGNCFGPRLGRSPGMMFALGIMAVQLLVATLVLFSLPASILTFVLGFPVAFAFGQVFGMLFRAAGKN